MGFSTGGQAAGKRFIQLSPVAFGVVLAHTFVMQAERNIAEMQTRQAEQKAKLDRLRGTPPSSDKDETK